jgi:hypothetical protein
MRLLVMTACVFAFCAVACVKKPQPAAPPVVATSTAPSPAPQPPHPSAAKDETPKAANKARAPKAGLGDAYTANKSHNEGTRVGDKALERELAQLRPKHREYVSLSGKHIDVNFTGAKAGPPGSHLSDLSFELTDGTHSATTTLTDKKRDVAMTVDLGWCRVKVKPIVSKAAVSAIGTGERASRVERNGEYDIVLLDKNGKSMATASVKWDRRLIAGYASPGYECFMRRDPEWEDEQIFNIVKTTGDQSKVLQLRWYDKALTHQQVETAKGSLRDYAFPAGELEVIKPGS